MMAQSFHHDWQQASRKVEQSWDSHKGWECVDFEDLGDLTGTCDMCETQAIRYVHYMQHPNYTGLVGAGCICAEKMSGDYEGPKRREAAAKSAVTRRARWLGRRWMYSRNGNPYIKTDGFHIVIYPQGPDWKALIEDTVSNKKRFSRRTFKTQDQAKLAAFDAMIRFEAEWRGSQ
jgi:hypothetical protein